MLMLNVSFLWLRNTGLFPTLLNHCTYMYHSAAHCLTIFKGHKNCFFILRDLHILQGWGRALITFDLTTLKLLPTTLP